MAGFRRRGVKTPQPVLMEPSLLEQTLLQLTVPDSAVISSATEILKKLLDSPSCVPQLLNQIQSSARPEARQLAGILLRKKIGSHWKFQKPEEQEQIKKVLLDRLIHESERSVQRSITGVVAAVATVTVPKGQWNDLLAFVNQAAGDANPHYRELAYLLYRVMIDSIGSSFKDQYSSLLAIFGKGLVDTQSARVREESLLALAGLFHFADDDVQVMAFEPLIPHICQATHQFVAQNDDNASVCGFELLDYLAESNVPILDNHIAAVTRFAVSVTIEPMLSMSIRERACSLLVWIIKYQPKKLVAHCLVPDILNSAFNLMVQEGEDDDGEVSSPQSLALEILDDLMIQMPNEAVYLPTINAVREMISSSHAPHRASGYLLLFVMAEGCMESMKAHVEGLLEIVVKGMSDTDAKVRASASSALTQFAEHLQPEVLNYHHVVIPTLVTQLDRPGETDEFKRKYVSALDTFVGELSPEQSAVYIPELANRMAGLVQSGVRTLQECGLSAIGGIASASKSGFTPFFDHFIGIAKSALHAEAEDDLILRAYATRAIACMCSAVGKDIFRPHFEGVFQQSYQAFEKFDNVELREATFVLYETFSELFKDEFNPYVPLVLSKLLPCLVSNDGLMCQSKGTDHDQTFGNVGANFDSEGEYEGKDDEDDEDDFEGDERVQYSIISGYLDEKVAAIRTLTEFFKSSGKPLLVPDVLGPTLSCIEHMTEYMHDSMRILSLLSYDAVFQLIHSSFTTQPWTQGALAPLPHEVAEVVNQVFPVLVTSIGADYDKSVASIAADVLARAIKLLGPGCLEKHLPVILETVISVFREETPAQKFAKEDATATVEDIDELLDSAGDVVTAMARVMGPEFSRIFAEVLPVILQSLSPIEKKVPGHIASLLGCMGDVTSDLGASVLQFAESIMPIFLHSLHHASAVVRRASAFGLGSMFLSGGKGLSRYYHESLRRLQPLLAIDVSTCEKQAIPARDNACSAIAKMISHDAESLPMTEVLPLFLQGLPLLDDMIESVYVYPCLCNLLTSPYRAALLPHFNHVVRVLASALTTESIEDKLKPQLASSLQSLVVENRAHVEEILPALTDAQRSAVLQCLSR